MGEAQTLAPLRKHREVQATGTATAAVGVQASGWAIEDSYNQLAEEEDAAEEEAALAVASVLPSGAPVFTGEVIRRQLRSAMYSMQSSLRPAQPAA